MAAKSKSRTATQEQRDASMIAAALPGDLVNSASVMAANPFIGLTLVSTLLNVNSVLEFVADAAKNRDDAAHAPVTGEGLASICRALHNALAHQAIALQTPGRMQRKATAVD